MSIFNSLTGDVEKRREESMRDVSDGPKEDALPDAPVELPPQDIPLENQGGDSDMCENSAEEEVIKDDDALVEPWNNEEVPDVN